MCAEGHVFVDAAIIQNPYGSWFAPGAGKTHWFKDHENAPEMVVVPPGSFIMGSPDDEPERAISEGPQHRVTISQPFSVGRHSVTRGQFAAFVNATGYEADGANIWTGSEWKFDAMASWRKPGFAQDDSHPVVCISWDDAQAYAAWLSRKTKQPYRLLSEAEREYATRAGTTTPFWWGSAITRCQANYNSNYTYAGGGCVGEYRQCTVSVDCFAPNPWGLYNVHGNVWEWCEDVWHDCYRGAPSDGSVWLQGGNASCRVVRGGAWNYDPRGLRAANRYGYFADERDNLLSFRLARTLGS